MGLWSKMLSGVDGWMVFWRDKSGEVEKNVQKAIGSYEQVYELIMSKCKRKEGWKKQIYYSVIKSYYMYEEKQKLREGET